MRALRTNSHTLAQSRVLNSAGTLHPCCFPHYLRMDHNTIGASSRLLPPFPPGCHANNLSISPHPPPRNTPFSPTTSRARLRSTVPTPSTAPDASPSSFTAPRALESIDRTDHGKFVRFLHLASPYVVGHRSRVFVIVIPGEVMTKTEHLARFLEDILLLHGLGVSLVLVAGAKEIIDRELASIGQEARWDGAYRVTDAETMKIAVAAAGSISTEIAAQLSRAPSIPMMRRHARGEGRFHFAPAVQVVSGNYVTAKRRGIVNGTDYGFMGQVRFVQREAIRSQLDAGNIVLLTNVGVSASGELLNCNAYDVATHAAVELNADKLLCLTGEDVRKLRLPHYLPLDDAESLIRALTACGPDDEECNVNASLEVLGRGKVYSGDEGEDAGSESDDGWTSRFWHAFPNGYVNSSSSSASSFSLAAPASALGMTSTSSSRSSNRNGNGSTAQGQSPEMLLDLDSWQQIGFPSAVLAAVVACRQGVSRAHLIDIEQDGAMLLELYTRDGITGVCMIAADLYEGIRPAEAMDVNGIVRLLLAFTADGHDIPFAPEDAGNYVSRCTVIEREGRVLGVAVCLSLGEAPDKVSTAEIVAFVVEPSVRRQGLGDSLLDYVEQRLRRQGFRRVVIVADQGSYEWFAQRGFALAGAAASSDLIPEERRKRARPVSKLFVKSILEVDAALDAPAGKRIGF